MSSFASKFKLRRYILAPSSSLLHAWGTPGSLLARVDPRRLRLTHALVPAEVCAAAGIRATRDAVTEQRLLEDSDAVTDLKLPVDQAKSDTIIDTDDAVAVIEQRLLEVEDGVIPGRAVQVDPIKSMSKLHETLLLKLRYDGPLSIFAFNFSLRRYTLAMRWMSPCR
jgi:hypothetical protein